ncbi:hypothetical protein J3Q64DRAFT_1775960 [Phycomyces blakesleeanus]|uniref:Uncharacterized protein n=1 Tax=Phycomyces blakesleeanus TaxID=4837 RepID=A0ABR3AJP7_PHYBL
MNLQPANQPTNQPTAKSFLSFFFVLKKGFFLLHFPSLYFTRSFYPLSTITSFIIFLHISCIFPSLSFFIYLFILLIYLFNILFASFPFYYIFHNSQYTIPFYIYNNLK